MADAGGPIKAGMKPSPSPAFNNLRVAGERLIYAHQDKLCIIDSVPSSSGTAVETHQIQTLGNIHSLATGVVQKVMYLVAATENGVQVFDHSGGKMFFEWRVPESQKGGEEAVFCRGAAFNVSADGSVQLCVGLSNGNVQVFSVYANCTLKPTAVLTKHGAPITALSTPYQSRGSKWADDMLCNLVSADEAGCVTVWEAEDAFKYKVVAAIVGDGTPIVSLAVRKDHIIAGRLDGKICVYGMKDVKLRCEIVAHSRFLTAMDVHPSEDLLVSASEDASIAVWSLPLEGGSVAPRMSGLWHHCMLAGAAFLPGAPGRVAAVAYDTEELTVWSFAKQ